MWASGLARWGQGGGGAVRGQGKPPTFDWLTLCHPSLQIVVVSSHSREIAEEVHQATYLDALTDMAYSAAQVGHH